MDSNRDHRRNNERRKKRSSKTLISSRICNTHKYVPIDLTVEILSRLPIKSVGRFASVSKSWRDTITSRRFSITYAKNNPFSMFYHKHACDPRLCSGQSIEVSENGALATAVQPKGVIPFLEIVGLCNGLLCLRESMHVFVILNPITNEHTSITIPNDDHGWGTQLCDEYYHGFGYSPSTNEYKLFKGLTRILRARERRDEYAVFTVGVDERWRKLPPNLFPDHDKGMWQDPVVCDGAFHWLVHWPYDKLDEHTRVHILAFDIATESMRRIPTPRKSRRYLRLLVLSGRLCLERSEYAYGTDLAFASAWRIEDCGSHVAVPAGFIYAYRLEAGELFDCATKSGKLVFKAKAAGRLGLYCPKKMRDDVLPHPYDVMRLYEFTPTFSSIDEIVYGRYNR